MPIISIKIKQQKNKDKVSAVDMDIFFSLLSIYKFKHKVHSHQSYIYYDMPSNKKK